MPQHSPSPAPAILCQFPRILSCHRIETVGTYLPYSTGGHIGVPSRTESVPVRYRRLQFPMQPRARVSMRGANKPMASLALLLRRLVTNVAGACAWMFMMAKRHVDLIRSCRLLHELDDSCNLVRRLLRACRLHHPIPHDNFRQAQMAQARDSIPAPEWACSASVAIEKLSS